MGSYRIEIDEFRCNGFALCAAALPEIFALREDEDIVMVLNPQPGDEYRVAVKAAAARCPKQAIIIHEDQTATGGD